MSKTLKTRAAEALAGVTPGPWRLGVPEDLGVWGVGNDDAGELVVIGGAPNLRTDKNVQFVAASRTLVPELLARIEALEHNLAEVIGTVQEYVDMPEKSLRSRMKLAAIRAEEVLNKDDKDGQ